MTSSKTIRGFAGAFAAGASLALLAGCAANLGVWTGTGEATQATLGVSTGTGEATLDVSPAFAPAHRTVQALVEPYTFADVNHLLVKVYALEGQTETAVVGPSQAALARDLTGDALESPIRFRNLHFDTAYRVRGYAFKAADTEAANQISADTSSYFDIKLTNDDRPDVATLSVQLVDKTFNGQGTSSIDIHDGVVNNEGPETFGVPAY